MDVPGVPHVRGVSAYACSCAASAAAGVDGARRALGTQEQGGRVERADGATLLRQVRSVLSAGISVAAWRPTDLCNTSAHHLGRHNPIRVIHPRRLVQPRPLGSLQLLCPSRYNRSQGRPARGADTAAPATFVAGTPCRLLLECPENSRIRLDSIHYPFLVSRLG